MRLRPVASWIGGGWNRAWSLRRRPISTVPGGRWRSRVLLLSRPSPTPGIGREAATWARSPARRCWARATGLACVAAWTEAVWVAASAPFRGLGGRRGVNKINRHQAYRPVQPQGTSRGNLQHPLRPGELDLKGRSQRIAPPGRARNAAAGLEQERIVHADDQGSVGRQGRFDLVTGGGEQGVGVGPPVAVEAIVSGPIVVLAVLGGEQAGEGVAAQGDELGQRMGGMTGGLGGGSQRTVQEAVQVLEEGGFFLSGTGSGGTTWRERIRWPLSTRVHSSCSPFWKSRAWASGVGKLM